MDGHNRSWVGPWAHMLVLMLLVSLNAQGCEAKGRIIDIKNKNYDKFVKKGPWLMIASASWCPHCKKLEPVLAQLATKLEGRVKLGKIDGPAEPILIKRLHIKAYPHIFHVDKQGQIRDYEGGSTLDELYDFATYKYKKQEPIPWYQTPHSSVGQIKKFILEAPKMLKTLYEYLHIDLGLSDVFIIFSGLIMPLIAGVFTIAIIDFVFVHMHVGSRRVHAHAD